MTVDIIIPTYHRYELLAETLESVCSQTYSDWKCWIAEDGESEETRGVVEPFLKDRRFHYLPGPHVGTPAAPRNRAIEAGRAPLIAFLDDDDIWLPEKLEKQVAFMSAHPDCVLLGSNAFIMKDGQDHQKDRFPLYFKKAPFGKVPYKKHVRDDYFINSSVVMRRSALKFAGLQNERLHKGPDGEDYDLWLRAGALGEMWLMDSPLVVYREFATKSSASNASRSRRRSDAYHVRFKIYSSAMNGVGDMPSPLFFPEHDRQYRLCLREMMFHAAGPRFLGRMRHRIWSSLADTFCFPPTKSGLSRRALRAFAACKARWPKQQNRSTIECVVFSKDRALQLHGLLATLREKVRPAVPVHVLYTASSDAHHAAYRELAEMAGKDDIRFIRQETPGSFRRDLLEILFAMKCDLIFFLVDDILFTEPVDLGELLRYDPDRFVPTLRMGRNLSRCYVLQSPQPLPQFLTLPDQGKGTIVWKWNQGDLDWGYPLSVDGHFFSRREIAAMAALVSFNAPNTFEDALQVFRPWFDNRFGVGYEKSKIINIPCNRVQKERENLSGELDPDMLLERWQQGYRIDYEKLYGFVNESAHQDMPLPLIPRK